jgi:hypothetical protein
LNEHGGIPSKAKANLTLTRNDLALQNALLKVAQRGDENLDCLIDERSIKDRRALL